MEKGAQWTQNPLQRLRFTMGEEGEEEKQLEQPELATDAGP